MVFTSAFNEVMVVGHKVVVKTLASQVSSFFKLVFISYLPRDLGKGLCDDSGFMAADLTTSHSVNKRPRVYSVMSQWAKGSEAWQSISR